MLVMLFTVNKMSNLEKSLTDSSSTELRVAKYAIW